MGLFSEIKINWSPFSICAPGEKAPYPRSLSTPEGLGDRLRFVAFAEKQATHAFETAADVFSEVSPGVKKIWRKLAAEEQKHLQWLLWRIEEIGLKIDERPVSLALWNSFDHCADATKFAVFMANAEERGRIAGEQFYETLLSIDPITARVFQQIALEEQEHIRLAKTVTEMNFKVPEDFDTRVAGLPLENYAELTRSNP